MCFTHSTLKLECSIASWTSATSNFVTKSKLSTDHPSTFSCPLSYWMAPFHEILLSDATSVTQSPIIIQTPEIELVQDFLCELDMKSHMYLVESIIFSLYPQTYNKLARGSVPSSHTRGQQFEPRRRQYFKLLLDPEDCCPSLSLKQYFGQEQKCYYYH